jgi:RNA polymerase sigma-70 factor (ECF subfamily)
MPEDVPQLVDHLFRRQAGRMVSTLLAILGSRHLQLAEDVVQESLLRALQLWPFQGIPEHPQAWLIQVARNMAVDKLRRENLYHTKIAEIQRRMTSNDGTMPDEQLALMFLCCQPAIPSQSQVCLTLKLAAGFSVAEIASAFLATEDAIAQRIVRAKRQIRDEELPMELPPDRHLVERLDSVLNVLYLIFNEGYSASGGPALLRRDLCDEAIYLTTLLASNLTTALPKVHALLALELFQAARLDARTDSFGDLLLLEDQDRSLWDRSMIARGFRHFDLSSSGPELSAYHVQAAIAATHAAAPSLDATNWEQTVGLYDQLMWLNPSPVVELNRAVAIGRRDGAAAALEALALAKHDPVLLDYYLLHAVLADCLARTGRSCDAAACYRSALLCKTNDAERRFLERKLQLVSTEN